MDLNFLKWQLFRGPFVGRVLLRAFMLVLALIVVSLMQMARDIRVIEPIMTNIDECPLNVDSKQGTLNRTSLLNSASSFTFPLFGASPTACVESENLIRAVFKELMVRKLLHSNARVLCVGEGSSSAVASLHGLGLTNALGVEKHPFFSLFKRRFVYELDYDDNEFDFAFSADLDRVSVPALLVLEIERVLKPGGTGAMLVGGRRLYPGGVIRSAANVASFLKSSDIVQLCSFDSFSLVIFKKRLQTSSPSPFEQFQLPTDCPLLSKNKPVMDISAKNRSVFINVGAGELAKKSIAKMSKLYMSKSNRLAATEVFVIDHKASILSSYVTDPNTNFVYYPALGGDATASETEISPNEHLVAPLHEEAFNFISWFNKTVSSGDLVILMMNAKSVELNILVEMFKTGAICRVDELFLRCENSPGLESTMGSCMDVFASLRKSGVYVHEWFGG